jgi:3-hydroxyacyl-[acyl-carrier protein] dehydratase/trans-2-decenoyl-[acyl-carrier protein] isomerase
MLSYEDFCGRSAFNKEEILAFAHGRLIKDEPRGFASRLPAPPFLMIDEILSIQGEKSKGRLVAEREINLDDWFFQCHFLGDPVQPGSLGVDAVWQLVGFFCAWSGGIGAGRALGCEKVVFEGQIRPRDHTTRYEVNVRRFTNLVESGASIAVADFFNDTATTEIYTIKGARAGVFLDIEYADYPLASRRSRGGPMKSSGGEQSNWEG